MKCADARQLLELMRAQEANLADVTRLETHLLHCPACTDIRTRLQKEEALLHNAIASPSLPEEFIDSVLDQLEPYPAHGAARRQEAAAAVQTPAEDSLATRSLRPRNPWMRRIGSSVAAVLLLGAVSMYVSPTFAAYVSSFVSRVGGELGLKRAAEQGYDVPVNQSVSDRGYTLRVKDIIADSARLVVSYTLEGSDGKPLEDQYLPYFEGSRIYLTDPAGNMVSDMPEDHQLGPDYGDITFVSNEPWPENLVLHFEINQIGIQEPKEVHMQLNIPVNVAKSKETAPIIPVNAVYESPQGVVFSFDRVMYAPSATRFDLITYLTGEALSREKEKVRVLDGEEDDSIEVDNHAFSYRIENESGQVVARSDLHYAGPDKLRTLYFSRDFTWPKEEGKPSHPGEVHWKGAIVPASQPEKLTFILEELEKIELARFSIPIRPEELKKAPVTRTYDESGDTYTIKGLKKGVNPMTQEAVWILDIEGKLKISDMPRWNLTDGAGKKYEVAPDYTSMRVKQTEDGGGLLEQKLLIKGMDTPPDELTLTLRTYKKRYTNLDWRVPIPPNE